MNTKDECSYLRSRDIAIPVQFYIRDLHIPLSINDFSTFVLSIVIYDGDTPIHSTPIISCISFGPDGKLQSDDWINLPFQYNEIRLNMRAVISILDYEYHPLYVTSITFYDKYEFRNGLYKLRCFKTDEHFDAKYLDPAGCLVSNDPVINMRRKSEQIVRKGRVQWLDTMAESYLSHKIHFDSDVTSNVNELAVHSTLASNVLYYTESRSVRDNTLNDSDNDISIQNLNYLSNSYPVYLILRFPYANIPIIYCEDKYTDIYKLKPLNNGVWNEVYNISSGIISYVNLYEYRETRDFPNMNAQRTNIGRSSPLITPQLSPPTATAMPVYTTPLSPFSNDAFTDWKSAMDIVYDYHNFNENPITSKYASLERSEIQHYGAYIKPSKEEKTLLNRLIAMPTTPDMLTESQKLLIFKYRYTLIENKKALVKFIYSINWDNEYEASEAKKLLSQWERIDVDDALILLAKDVQQPFIREYAISILQSLSDEELDIYLLQLVSAIKWEPGFEKPDEIDENVQSQLVNFLFFRASQTLVIGIWFWHYLNAFTAIQKYGPIYAFVFSKFQECLGSDAPIEGYEVPDDEAIKAHIKDMKLSIYQAAKDQGEFISKVLSLGNQINNEGGKANKKAQRLKELLNGENPLTIPQDLRLPLHPEVVITGLNIEKSKVFKSARAPFVLEFRVQDPVRKVVTEDVLNNLVHTCAIKDCGKVYQACVCKNCANCGVEFSTNDIKKNRHHCRLCDYPICSNCATKDMNKNTVCKDINKCHLHTMTISQIMFKLGDDIRQDQLILQMIRLMDKLLKEVSLDLNLSPYRVLPLNDSEGLLEMVMNSVPISQIKVMQDFLRENNPSKSPPFYIDKNAMSRYIKSFAGYCVITYLLGIGDRHLDNIMVKKSGELFHIDFGFILGRDPKWNPPKIRITPEMVNGFGGPNSENFKSFISYCCQTYIILRKNANLIYGLLRLMEDSGIHDISPDALNQVVAKFQLDLTEEQAELNFVQIIDNCLKDIWPGILEFAHKIATAAR